VISTAVQSTGRIDLGCFNNAGFWVNLSCNGTGVAGSSEIQGSLKFDITDGCVSSNPPAENDNSDDGVNHNPLALDVSPGSPQNFSSRCEPTATACSPDFNTAACKCRRFAYACWTGSNVDNPTACSRQEIGADVTASVVP
jgi:hypothetical protein